MLPSRPRYEGNPTSASGLAPTEIYNNQPAGMWALNSSSTARPPHSPSRNADISSAILKTRRALADSTAAASGQDGVGDDHAGIGGSSSLPLASCAVLEEESQTGTLSAGEDAAQDQQATTAPSDSQFTQLASSGSTGMSPPALTGSTPPGLKREPGRHLEFTFPRKTPSENDGDAGDETETLAIDTTATTNPPQTDSANQTSETTIEPEEDYDEPVYASIRP
ncbi:hypothetical protein QFC22_004488 [Naganishia vaughanmartiniae]|uniref:Uncharacterized protein n=1 Tax=Naganishia vaughanmartiniae TaxID=1424756 RepID=A0ACC2X181_9TREE|nr:hypothetical protein QFC22_004488 [Naganishia vaughanmartiniae]